jgi:hypothetical protein
MNPGSLAGTVIMTVFVTNAVLTGVKVALGMIKDKTATKLDDDAYDKVAKAVDMTGAVIDWITANKEHTPSAVPNGGAK